MRPLRLEIEGFTAFRDRQEIDFEALDLFVITGPTGAGKTSILDAMVFALYGRVPRLNSSHGTSDFISLGQANAKVQFDFSVDGEGVFRVARRITRRTGGQTATLERRDGDGWVNACERGGVTECNKRLRELLVLDYDSFCKAVLLPQGEFHRFLKGEAKERRQVLVSLLGVGYFLRMAELARGRRGRLIAGVERTEEILAEQYADATQERVDELHAAAGPAADRFSALSSALTDAEERMREAARHDTTVRALQARRDEFAGLAAALRDKVEACKAAEDAGATASEALRSAAAALDAEQQATARAESAVSELEAETGTLDHLGEVAAAARTLSAVADEEDEARAAVAAAEQAEADAARALESAEAALAEAKRLVVDATAAEQQAEERAGTARREAEEQNRAREQAEAQAGELASAREGLAAARSAAEGTRTKADCLRAALAAATEHLEEHRRANAVAELAHGVAPGDPCPVCAVPLSTAVVVAPDVGRALEQARAEEQTARTAAESASEQATRAGERAEAAQTQVEALEQQLAVALHGHATVDALRADAETSQHAADKAGEELEQHRASRTRLEAEASTVQQRLLEERETLARRQARTEGERRAVAAIEERRAQAERLLAEHFGGAAPADATERIAAQRTRLTAAVEAAGEARKTRDAAARAHGEASTQATDAERRLGQIDLELTKLRTRADTASVASAEFLDQPLAEAPSAPERRDAGATQLAEWCDAAVERVTAALDRAAGRRDAAVAGVVAIAAGHAIDAPSGEQALAHLRQAERDASTAAERTRSAAAEAERRAKQRAEMEARIGDEREQIAILGDLATELRADRFVEYIVQETLELLAARASEELLRISDERYSLVTEEGDFSVVDHANADELRSVKTLSGGETFLASLALALALSRHVGELATEGLGAKLEAVFIDEGFGTLDPETLEEVIDALERLRADDLVVGVISHVPALAERVRAGLQVHKEHGRSRITQSLAA